MITLRPIYRLDDSLQGIYSESFPVDERRPVESIHALLGRDDSPFRAYAIEAGGEVAGFVTVWIFEEARYVEHLVTAPALRGSGIGGNAVDTLRALAPTPLLLEVEPPSDADPMAARRIDFYRRHGFRLHTGFSYIQPPYTDSSQPVRLMIMTSGELPCTLAEFVDRRLLGCVYDRKSSIC